MKTPIRNKSNENQQGGSKGNQSINAKKETQKSRRSSNSGGQMSYHTDNKKKTVNKQNKKRASGKTIQNTRY